MIYLPPHQPHFSPIIPLIDGGSTLLVQIVISSQEQSLSSLNPIGPVVLKKIEVYRKQNDVDNGHKVITAHMTF